MLAYLSGPMTGYPDYNYPLFRGAAADLRNQGWDVLNPAETAGGVTHLDRATSIEMNVGYVQAADCVVVLPGWHASQGAQLEVLLATNLGKPVYLYEPLRGVVGQVRVTSCTIGFQVDEFDPEPVPAPLENDFYRKGDDW